MAQLLLSATTTCSLVVLDPRSSHIFHIIHLYQIVEGEGSFLWHSGVILEGVFPLIKSRVTGQIVFYTVQSVHPSEVF